MQLQDPVLGWILFDWKGHKRRLNWQACFEVDPPTWVIYPRYRCFSKARYFVAYPYIVRWCSCFHQSIDFRKWSNSSVKRSGRNILNIVFCWNPGGPSQPPFSAHCPFTLEAVYIKIEAGWQCKVPRYFSRIGAWHMADHGIEECSDCSRWWSICRWLYLRRGLWKCCKSNASRNYTGVSIREMWEWILLTTSAFLFGTKVQFSANGHATF